MFSRSARSRGFTILELLVSIAIIGLLTAIVLFMLTEARSKSRDARRFEDIKQIQNALELQSVGQSGHYLSGTDLTPLVTGGYIAILPTDPLNTGAYGYTYQGLTSSSAACDSGTCTGYVLRAVLEQSSQKALLVDIDGFLGGVNCEDPALCIIP